MLSDNLKKILKLHSLLLKTNGLLILLLLNNSKYKVIKLKDHLVHKLIGNKVKISQ